jgi:hypothetical protein
VVVEDMRGPGPVSILDCLAHGGRQLHGSVLRAPPSFAPPVLPATKSRTWSCHPPRCRLTFWASRRKATASVACSFWM